MTTRIRRFERAGDFLERAEPWLLEAEAEHNLLLGIVDGLRRAGPPKDASAYLATVEIDGDVRGCAFRTPPHKLGITRMPVEAIPALAADVGGHYDALPAVLGPEDAASAFAEAWSGLRHVSHHVGMRQGIHRLRALIPPPDPPAGHLRPVRLMELDLAVRWGLAFADETGVSHADTRGAILERITRGTMWFWEDGGRPKSMVGEGGETRNGARVSWVFTPPAERGRGYASACVAALTRHMLDAGRRMCFLYTDLANPTSNRIYARLGYERVAEVVDVHFSTEGDP